jgi:hypothetical protein
MNSKSLYSVLLPETIYSMHVYCCSAFRSLKISTLKEREKKWSRGNTKKMLEENKGRRSGGGCKQERKVTSWCLTDK